MQVCEWGSVGVCEHVVACKCVNGGSVGGGYEHVVGWKCVNGGGG